MEKKNYVQPEIQVLQIEIEKGFAASQQESSPWGDM
jgi:hypothetical protein